MTNIVVNEDIETLAQYAASRFVDLARDAMRKHGRFFVALSGGSTPKALYGKLRSAEIDWGNVVFFFGDERDVPPDDEQSNFRMADTHLFRPLEIRPENVFRWLTEIGEPERIAENYSSTLVSQFANLELATDTGTARAFLPRFDLILLGMGADGHTASLFPHTEALKENEHLTAANWVPQLDTWRYTFTFPLINNARNVMFMVAGKDKAQTLCDVIEGERNPEALPSQSVHMTDGDLFWILDREAAESLSGR